MTDLTAYLPSGTTDSTVTAIYDAIKANHHESPRRYLGASIIGKPCARALWMDFHWVSFEDYDGRLLRLFDTGHREEHRLTQNLRDAGVIVHDVDDRTGEQFGVSFHGGHFRGHADGVALGIHDAPKSWHLLEYKTHSQKSFDTLTRVGVQTAKPEHYAQMQVYMHGLGLTRAYYLARNKNTDALYGEPIKYDKAFALSILDRAERIIFSDEPPLRISERADWYQCKFCHYHRYCHPTPADLPEPLPNANCRTCCHSTPLADGTWHCERHEQTLDDAKQACGCPAHRYIPMLLPNLEQTDYDGEAVFYRSATNERYINDNQANIRKIK